LSLDAHTLDFILTRELSVNIWENKVTWVAYLKNNSDIYM